MWHEILLFLLALTILSIFLTVAILLILFRDEVS